MPLSNTIQFQPDLEIFKALIDVSAELVWVMDVKSGAVSWFASEACKEKFNLKETESENEFWLNGLHPSDKIRIQEEFNNALLNPSIGNYNRKYRVKGIGRAWHRIHDKIKFIRDQKGLAQRVVGVWIDVSKDLNYEQELEEALKNHALMNDALAYQKEELRQLNEQLTLNNKQLVARDEILSKTQKLAKIGNWIYDPKAQLFTLSEELYDMYGMERSKRGVKANEFFQFYNESSRIIVADLINRADKGQLDPFDVILEIHTPLGHNKWLRVCGWPEESSQGILQVYGLTYDISFAKEAEERLKSSEYKFAQAFHNSPDLMILFRQSDWMIVDVNYKILPMLGYNKIDILGTSAAEFNVFVHESEKKKFVDMLNTEGRAEMECECYRKDGSIIQVIVSFNTLEFNGKKHFIATIKDISDWKAAEQKFAKAFHNNPDMMVIIRKQDQVLIDANEKVFEITGYRREEMLGQKATDIKLFVNQQDREVFWRAFQKGTRIEMEAEWKRKEGRLIHVLVSLEQLFFDNTEHMISIVKDISARKIAEEKFIKAFELSPDLMMIFRERDLVLVECNSNIESVGGYKREEVIGKSALDFNLFADESDRKFHTEKYFGGEGRVNMESQFIRKDRTTFYGALSSRRTFIDGEAHMIVVVRDISEIRRKEQERIESEANLYAVIDNTNLVVWSLDKQRRLIKANRLFEKFVFDHYGIEIKPGEKIISKDIRKQKQLAKIWNPRYARALAGEKFKISEKLNGRFVEFSFNPILDNNEIIGIVVLAEDITERITNEQELKNALNKVAEYKLMALRSVMNPHFFFNVLNSIQYFIANNDRAVAINYLTAFSRLVRGILEHSVTNKISLSKEIEQLENYIVLEQLRFEDKFDYQIVLDEMLDMNGIEIPSLLIQPYVENAIIHGLYNKSERGLLKIEVRQETDAILVEIKDNGVGREAARKIKNQGVKTHVSMGMAITEERLRLINNEYKVSFDVIDLHDDKGEACGTHVKIWLRN